MNPQMSKVMITKEPSKAFQILEDETLEIQDVDPLDDDTLMITYKENENLIVEHSSYNIMVSLWTTALGRIELLKVFEEIESNGGKVLYSDTDSAVFKFPKNKQIPFDGDGSLGNFIDEFPDHELLEFCSGGCKQVGYRIKSKSTGEEKQIVKIRGFTLTANVAKEIHFNFIKREALNFGANDKYPVRQFTIRADRSGNLRNNNTNKLYSVTFNKGIVVDPCLPILPFGLNTDS